jgi:hypothetical protein
MMNTTAAQSLIKATFPGVANESLRLQIRRLVSDHCWLVRHRGKTSPFRIAQPGWEEFSNAIEEALHTP